MGREILLTEELLMRRTVASDFHLPSMWFIAFDLNDIKCTFDALFPFRILGSLPDRSNSINKQRSTTEQTLPKGQRKNQQPKAKRNGIFIKAKGENVKLMMSLLVNWFEIGKHIHIRMTSMSYCPTSSVVLWIWESAFDNHVRHKITVLIIVYNATVISSAQFCRPSICHFATLGDHSNDSMKNLDSNLNFQIRIRSTGTNNQRCCWLKTATTKTHEPFVLCTHW